ncbi:MAG: SMI1/KNR4 family protein [Planctomycetaceae bacterium]|nr:SMI1/KNR4 family protein [Planctomycetaceae bacterium]
MTTLKKYNNVSFDECGEPVSIEDIRSFQKSHELILPDDYVDFLCKVNGGIPTPSFLSLPEFYEETEEELIEEYEVRELFGFRITEYTTKTYLEKLCSNLIFPDVPDSRSFLMIGEVEAYQLYVATCKKYFGNIFRGSYIFGSTPGNDSIICLGVNLDDEFYHIYEKDIIATSFSSFLSLLH